MRIELCIDSFVDFSLPANAELRYNAVVEQVLMNHLETVESLVLKRSGKVEIFLL